MRGPCAPRTSLDQNDSPFNTKWYNCLYENDPLPLQSKQGVDDFKKLCAPMYKDDDMALCCNAEQLTILKRDLLAAEAVIGGCASCYLNFRMMWCHMTCSPNQSDFLIPKIIEKREKVNFTTILEANKVFKENQRKSQHKKEKCDKDNEKNDEDEDEVDDSNPPETETTTVITNHEERKKRSVTEMNAVIEVEYHMSDEFLLNLVKSCR